MTPLDLTGQTFGRLTVVAFAGTHQTPNGRSDRAWDCRCACGASLRLLTSRLRSGNTSSCGCAHRDQLVARSFRHGATRAFKSTAEYRAWCHMKARCFNRHNRKYPLYGGRGITVCEQWRTSFTAFLADVGARPSNAHSIDRIDSNGHYEPGNVRWATSVEQARNRRSNVVLIVDGQALCATEWASRVGLPPRVLLERIALGWSAERALSTPHQPRRKAA